MQRTCYFVVLNIVLLSAIHFPLAAQSISTYADGLVAPQGLEFDGQGWLWVAEQGTGNDDGRISIVTPDGIVHPFLIDLPSNIVQGQPESVHHILLDGNNLWGTLGLGETDPASLLLRADISGFTPGDTPLSLNDVTTEDIGTFVLAADLTDDSEQTNIYNLTMDSSGDLYIVDASANAVVRRQAGSGSLSIYAELPATANQSGVGPPFVQAVPTGIIASGSSLYVATFGGFPFTSGESRIYEVASGGTVSEYASGFTGAIDLTRDLDGDLVILQYGSFSNGFQPNTGRAIKLASSGNETLTTGLNFATGIAYDTDGNIYFSMMEDGEIQKFGVPTSVDDIIGTADQNILDHSYPNPFRTSTNISFTVGDPGDVRVEVFNVLGQQVRTLVNNFVTAGKHEVVWDGTDAAGRKLSPGKYIYRLSTNSASTSRSAILLR